VVATALYTGLRISELLGLTWDDIEFDHGVIHVRAQLSCAPRAAPPCRVRTKTAASVREVPLVGLVFATFKGTPHGGAQRYSSRAAACCPNRLDRRRQPSGFALSHLRHTFARHLILDLGLEVAQAAAFSATPVRRSR
jgi:integrase